MALVAARVKRWRNGLDFELRDLVDARVIRRVGGDVAPFLGAGRLSLLLIGEGLRGWKKDVKRFIGTFSRISFVLGLLLLSGVARTVHSNSGSLVSERTVDSELCESELSSNAISAGCKISVGATIGDSWLLDESESDDSELDELSSDDV